jgi:stearoyl-CoA desaturase (delta-9 desaturase)
VLNAAYVVAIHVAALMAFARGGSGRLLALAVATYAIRASAVIVGYHRYFAHRAYEVNRGVQLFLALLGTTAGQGGPLWWAAVHRMRHLEPRAERDVHSSTVERLLGSHAGYCLSRAHEPTRVDIVPDLAGYPELRLLDRWSFIGPLAMISLLLAFGGVDAALWGFGVSTCALLHTTFTLDALAHRTEMDATFHVLRGLERLGLVRGVRPALDGPAGR